MPTIGQFCATDYGYEGTISTLAMERRVKLVPNTNKKSEDSPDFFVKIGECDLGFARKAIAQGENGKPYLKVFLNDPSFADPVWAAMFEADGHAELVWSRPKGKSA